MPFDRPDIIRPPSEWMSYYLPLTGGCSNNTCSFCAYCRSKLRIRDIEDVKEEIDALALYTQRGIRLPAMPGIVYAIAQQWDGRRIFLQDGDALVYPFLGLKEVLQHLNQRFPGLERIAAYATAQDILRRSPDELRALKDLKLGILYMGAGHNVGAKLKELDPDIEIIRPEFAKETLQQYAEMKGLSPEYGLINPDNWV